MPKVSLIYEYFSKLDGQNTGYKCKSCERIVSSSSTSNLRQHLKTHKDVFADFEKVDSKKRAPRTQSKIPFPKVARMTVSVIVIRGRAVQHQNLSNFFS